MQHKVWRTCKIPICVDVSPIPKFTCLCFSTASIESIEIQDSYTMSHIEYSYKWLIPLIIVFASTIIELQYDALLNDPSIAIIVLDAQPKKILVRLIAKMYLLIEKWHFPPHRKSDIFAGNSERIESISYVGVNDEYHLILIDDRPNKTIFELFYHSYSPIKLYN